MGATHTHANSGSPQHPRRAEDLIDTDSAAPSRRGKVLIIDDTPANIHLIMALLVADYDVTFAVSGEKGLALAERDTALDLILLDVRMPGMDGYEVCRRLKENDRTRDIPVMFVTGEDSELSEAKGLELGAVDYLTRPLSAPILRARVRTHVRIHRQQRRFETLASVDVVTELANRRKFEEVLGSEWDRARREQTPLGLIFADIDLFKTYNDHYGHGVGDEVLRRVAFCLQDMARRPADVPARFGGEELLMLMPQTDLPGVAKIAESFRARVEALELPFGQVTVSVGYWSMIPGPIDEPRILVERADAAMYAAKRAGRNRSRVWAQNLGLDA